MIPRRVIKIKIFLSVVIYVVKAAFMPLSATGESPANAGVARLCGVSPHSIPDTTTALPNQARYQLRYTRIFTFPPLYHVEEENQSFFLSAPVPMGKLVFAPLSVASRHPANAAAARLSGVSSYPVPDTAAALSSAALSRSVCP